MKPFSAFPEADFPVNPDYQSEYQERVVLGRKRMSKLKVVICGLARDVEQILPHTTARIEQLGAMFEDYRVVIYENDSQDRTKDVLSAWADRNPKADIMLEKRGDPVNPNARCLKRAERMARYRNACLETVRARYSHFDHVIVVDTDLEIGWSNDGVANTFGHDGWDFVGSNGLILRRCGVSMNTHLQYDAWAFRKDENFTPLTTAEVNYMSWQRGEPLVPVTCSFGGLGVYRMPAFLAGEYSGQDIEHVTHQEVARKNGFRKVFLNPSQITLYGRHRRRSDLWMIPLITATTKILESAQLVASPAWSRSFRAARPDSDAKAEHVALCSSQNQITIDEGAILQFSSAIQAAGKRPKAILLTSYNTGASRGRNLGKAGYSHDIVAALYKPLLERWGEVISVFSPRQNLEAAAEEARQRNLDPVHVAILPVQDLTLCQSAPNIVVPAWEFPDVPDHEFDCNPQNNWPEMANQCVSVFVGGPFTVKAMKSAGTTVPIHIVPVPTPDAYFNMPAWEPTRQTTMNCSGVVMPQANMPDLPQERPQNPIARETYRQRHRTPLKALAVSIEERVRKVSKKFLGNLIHGQYRRFERAFQAGKVAFFEGKRPAIVSIPYERSPQFDLSGIVYTSMFNPLDGRKNWQDLLSGFLIALGDREDATLVIKLITSEPEAIEDVFYHYYLRDIPHRCRVVFVTGYLTEEQLQQLAQASTYYVQTTKAEGNCLPLMNYMAAGRPGITPCHSAIADYFDDEVGFVVDSNPEPAAWPHDSRLRLRSSWARIVWTSLVDQLRASYDLVKSDPAAYQALSARSRDRMAGWASEEEVWRQLSTALDATMASMNKQTPMQEPLRQIA